jgi:glycosyl hydrolase family 43
MRRRFLVIAVAVVVAIVAVVFSVVLFSSPSQCNGLVFPTQRKSAVTSPPVGGNARMVDRVRRAFALSHTSVSYCHDFADPFALRVGDRYFAYATNSAGRTVPVLYGAGLFDVQHEGDALPHLPKWATAGKTWAPSVVASGDHYIMYYTTTERATGKQCISTAAGAQPTGPFIDASTAPLRCDAIDPRPITAGGIPYLLWAGDGSIHGARLGPDMRTIEGTTVTLLGHDQQWEDDVVEAPVMWRVGKSYLLFYSGNHFDTAAYAINYARCTGPLGPCTKARGPWIASEDDIAGPGGQDLFTDTDGNLWMVFHGWKRGSVGYPKGARYLFVIPIRVTRGIPTTG